MPIDEASISSIGTSGKVNPSDAASSADAFAGATRLLTMAESPTSGLSCSLDVSLEDEVCLDVGEGRRGYFRSIFASAFRESNSAIPSAPLIE
jgi:hypothetical protein